MNSTETAPAIQLIGVSKSYQKGGEVVHAAADVTLDVGERGMVAIARAVANDPRLVLADEPTGNLDSRSGQIVYELLREIAGERTVVVVTHSQELARLADRIIHIRDGRVLGVASGSVGGRQQLDLGLYSKV